MSPKPTPLDPVPRYEFLESKRAMDDLKLNATSVHLAQDKRIDGIIQDLKLNYLTKDGIKDQFKIELSDYKFIKVILGAVALGMLGLIFAVVQQFVLNAGAK